VTSPQEMRMTQQVQLRPISNDQGSRLLSIVRWH
jgi:hypothetical protein